MTCARHTNGSWGVRDERTKNGKEQQGANARLIAATYNSYDKHYTRRDDDRTDGTNGERGIGRREIGRA